jgi:hypothetical protein
MYLELGHKHLLPRHYHSTVRRHKAKQPATGHIVTYVIDRIPSPTQMWQKHMDSFREAWGKYNPSSMTAEFEWTFSAGIEYVYPLQWRSKKAVRHAAHTKQREWAWWCTYLGSKCRLQHVISCGETGHNYGGTHPVLPDSSLN